MKNKDKTEKIWGLIDMLFVMENEAPSCVKRNDISHQWFDMLDAFTYSLKKYKEICNKCPSTVVINKEQ